MHDRMTDESVNELFIWKVEKSISLLQWPKKWSTVGNLLFDLKISVLDDY